jgi:hypothetical protein
VGHGTIYTWQKSLGSQHVVIIIAISISDSSNSACADDGDSSVLETKYCWLNFGLLK